MIRKTAHRVRALLQASVGRSAIILTYHRVADLDRDPQLLVVSKARFEAQAAMLSTRYRVVSLSSLATDLTKHRLQNRTVAITFDDGYADNLTNARPVLERHMLPATVFVSSGYIGGEQEFWWDEAERITLGRESDVRWNALMPPEKDAHREYLDLMSELHPLPALIREKALAEARRRFGIEAGVRSAYRPMTALEVAELDASPLLEVGAHSADHEVLQLLEGAHQRTAIERDKAELERLCGRDIDLFSYPYGGRDDYGPETVSIVREVGFRAACANFPGLVKPSSDVFQLPRFVVRDWEADELARHIDAWFAGREG